ncbi:MAG: glycoside hydrolase family 140 protein [Chitinophagaceae bacterium]|nr:glycoside hydrolase family 140 protein [Chitinophagaceae bacterium]
MLNNLQSQLKISADKRHLVTTANKPFFWLGDTAWELFHRLTREEADVYLADRARKGFTVIQAVVLAELDGLNTGNAYGDKPLIDNDPLKPNEAYFKHVDYIVDKAQQLGLIIAMLPSWGDKWNRISGSGPEIFTEANASWFGEFLGKRYRNKSLVWVMGGDRDLQKPEHFVVIRAMAAGLKKGDQGKHLFTFHPYGGRSSIEFFEKDEWIDFHMHQSGHSSSTMNFKINFKARLLDPIKPYLDGEPRYEDHPNEWKPVQLGWMDDFDVRQPGYWSILSGATGHTYGNHNIWQMYTEKRQSISWARTHWRVALNHIGATQMGIMRKFFEKRNWQRLIPDATIVLTDNPEGKDYSLGAVSEDGDFLMVYLSSGKKVTIDTKKIKGNRLRGWLFNPRDGRTIDAGTFDNSGQHEFNPHAIGRGSDWVIVIDDASKNYPNPQVL